MIVEGFKRDTIPKLEVFRRANGKPFLHPDDPHVRALASDLPATACVSVATRRSAGSSPSDWRMRLAFGES